MGEGCLNSAPGFSTYVQHEAQLSVEADREAGRKPLHSDAKGDRRASGSREPFRCLPGVSVYTWVWEMILLNSAPPTPHPILISPSQLLSYLTGVPQRYLELLDPDRLSKVILFPLPKTPFLHSVPPAPLLPWPQPGLSVLTLGSQRTLSKPPS